MRAHALLNLLNEWKSDKMLDLQSNLWLFRNEFNEFNNTGARIEDFIYHMISSLIKNRICFAWKRQNFSILLNVLVDVIT